MTKGRTSRKRFVRPVLANLKASILEICQKMWYNKKCKYFLAKEVK